MREFPQEIRHICRTVSDKDTNLSLNWEIQRAQHQNTYKATFLPERSQQLSFCLQVS